jgi:hypothetical protein
MDGFREYVVYLELGREELPGSLHTMDTREDRSVVIIYHGH